MNTLVVNLFGGPGVGKSSCMAHLFALLKWDDVNCEMAPEFAKSKVWEGSHSVLDNQVYIFGKQQHAINRLLGKVDVVVTDSPLLLSLIYGKESSSAFKSLVRGEFFSHKSLNYFLARTKKYQEAGRLQTEDEAKGIDLAIENMLKDEGVSYRTITANPAAPHEMFLDITKFRKVGIY